MKTTLAVFLLGTLALSWGALANNAAAARLSLPFNPNATEDPAFAPPTHGATRAAMRVPSAPVKGIAITRTRELPFALCPR